MNYTLASRIDLYIFFRFLETSLIRYMLFLVKILTSSLFDPAWMMKRSLAWVGLESGWPVSSGRIE